MASYLLKLSFITFTWLDSQFTLFVFSLSCCFLPSLWTLPQQRQWIRSRKNSRVKISIVVREFNVHHAAEVAVAGITRESKWCPVFPAHTSLNHLLIKGTEQRIFWLPLHYFTAWQFYLHMSWMYALLFIIFHLLLLILWHAKNNIILTPTILLHCFTFTRLGCLPILKTCSLSFSVSTPGGERISLWGWTSDSET